jgi:hypothetical protein
MMPRGRKTLRLLADPPKGRRDDELRGPEGGFWKRLLNDDQNVDKLEDKHPFNTFVEILLGVIAVVLVGILLVLLVLVGVLA